MHCEPRNITATDTCFSHLQMVKAYSLNEAKVNKKKKKKKKKRTNKDTVGELAI
jgi:hypothetical protein